jgi:hypothetical protein
MIRIKPLLFYVYIIKTNRYVISAGFSKAAISSYQPILKDRPLCTVANYV